MQGDNKVILKSDIYYIIKHHKTEFNGYFNQKIIVFCGVLTCFIMNYAQKSVNLSQVYDILSFSGDPLNKRFSMFL